MRAGGSGASRGRCGSSSPRCARLSTEPVIALGLNGGLHAQMIGRGEIVGGDEAWGQGCVVAVEAAVEAHGIILDRLLAVAPVGKDNLAQVGEGEDRLDT